MIPVIDNLQVYKDSDGNIIDKYCYFHQDDPLFIVVVTIDLVFYTAAPFILMLLFNIILTVSLVAAAVRVGLFQRTYLLLLDILYNLFDKAPAY